MNLESLLEVISEEQPPSESNVDSETQKLAESLVEFQEYINTIEALAKIACFQNKIKNSNFSSDDDSKLEKIGAKLPLPIEAKDPKILKKFAGFLKEFANSSANKEKEKKAEQITNKLIDSGLISAEEVLEKLSNLREKTIEDLTILDKALDLHKQSEFLSIGELSDSPGHGTGNAKDRFVNDLLD
jgi:hypothetical protein